MRVAVFYDSDAENVFFDPIHNKTDSVFEIKHLLTQCLQKANEILGQADIRLLLTNRLKEIPVIADVASVVEYTGRIDNDLATSYRGLNYVKAMTSFYLIFSGNDIFSTGSVYAALHMCKENEFTKVIIGIKNYLNELLSPDQIVHKMVIGLLMSVGMNETCIIPDSLVLPDCVPVTAGCWHAPKFNIAHDGDAICGNNVKEKGEDCDSGSGCDNCRLVVQTQVNLKLIILIVIAVVVTSYKTCCWLCESSNGQVSKVRRTGDSVLL